MSKTPFPFDECVWFGADNPGTNFLLPIAQLITITFYDQWSSSEVKISGKPRFKWKLTPRTTCAAGAQAPPFLPFPEVFTHFSPSPNQQITERVLRDPEMRGEALFFLRITTAAPVAARLQRPWDWQQGLEAPPPGLGPSQCLVSEAGFL